MSIFVISDLHLSLSVDKPMDIYGGQWMNHVERIKKNWITLVREEDQVIIPGDISWGLRLEEAMEDLNWIDELPGKKILFKGNHDLWWNSIGKLNKLFESLTFVQNNYYETQTHRVCGSRGWACPGEVGFTSQDEKIYLRELGRLRLSLDAAMKHGDNEKEMIGVLHFPPTNEKMEPSGFIKLFEEYGIKKVVYGHLHGKEAYKNGLQGIRNGIEYSLTSCDKLECTPLKLIE